uniref:kelch repeat-containing protein 2-like n=1 Tax=Ciona intestinalis TaxID=7719 RepID=UPI000521580A|nr:kelch repeat-containing protein 2-like [Ciona intestinalis]|eukprot:XP_026695071.1 kelch repeat-containing protein 2-like [Ciona intestinalis]
MEVKASGDVPPPLEGHSISEHRGLLFMFGGEMGFASATEVPLWVFNPKLCSWSKKAHSVNAPCGRREHTAVVYSNQMCIYGGYVDLKGPDNGMWMYDFKTDTWSTVNKAKIEPCPAGRYKHAAVVYDNTMWVSGGLMGITDRNQTQVWTWSFLDEVWSQIKTKGLPYQLFNHAVSLVGGTMVAFGGTREDGQSCCKLWRVDLNEFAWKGSQNWQICHSRNKVRPSPCSSHCLVLLPTWDQTNKAIDDVIIEQPEINQTQTNCNENKIEFNSLSVVNVTESLKPIPSPVISNTKMPQNKSPKIESSSNPLIETLEEKNESLMFSNPIALDDPVEWTRKYLYQTDNVNKFSYNMSKQDVTWKPHQQNNRKFQTTSFIERSKVGMNNDGFENDSEKNQLGDEKVYEKVRSDSMSAFIENAKILETMNKSLDVPVEYVHEVPRVHHAHDVNYVHRDNISNDSLSEVWFMLVGGKLADSSLHIERPVSMWQCQF